MHVRLHASTMNPTSMAPPNRPVLPSPHQANPSAGRDPRAVSTNQVPFTHTTSAHGGYTSAVMPDDDGCEHDDNKNDEHLWRWRRPNELMMTKITIVNHGDNKRVVLRSIGFCISARFWIPPVPFLSTANTSCTKLCFQRLTYHNRNLIIIPTEKGINVALTNPVLPPGTLKTTRSNLHV